MVNGKEWIYLDLSSLMVTEIITLCGNPNMSMCLNLSIVTLCL